MGNVGSEVYEPEGFQKSLVRPIDCMKGPRVPVTRGWPVAQDIPDQTQRASGGLRSVQGPISCRF